MATATTYRTGDSGDGRGEGGDGNGPGGSDPHRRGRDLNSRQPTRWVRNIVILVLLALALLLGFSWRGLRAEALVSTSYGARAACACRFISQQDLGSCKGQIAVAGLGRTGSLIWLSEDADARTVKASVPLLASQTATFSPDRGCQLEPWTN